MSKVSIVILNYNGSHHLRSYLPYVISFNSNQDIYVVDNASSDDSAEIIKNEFPEVRLIQFSENLGFCQGYNKALKQIESDYYVILNSDIKVTEKWLDPILSLMDSDPEIAAVQPKILSLTEPEKFEYAGAGGGFIDTLGYPFCRGRIFNSLETDQGQYNNTIQVFWASGACLVVRGKAFREVDGFDPDFFAHMEEIDLCWRMQNHGYKIYYIGESTVYHLGGGTLSHVNPYKTFLNFSNNLWMLVKNESSSSLIWKLPVRAFLDLVAALKFTLFDSVAHGWSVIKAHLIFWKKIRYILKKRKKNQYRENTNKITTRYQGSVVFQYFVLNRKTYTNLRSKKKS